MNMQGIWIWENSQEKRDEYADFTQTFSLETGFGTVELKIAADSAYAAWVNGELAGFSQYGDFPHRRIYSTHDITAFCRPGENTLLVTAWHWGLTTFWETMGGWQDFRNAGSLCHGWSALAAYYYRLLLP